MANADTIELQSTASATSSPRPSHSLCIDMGEEGTTTTKGRSSGKASSASLVPSSSMKTVNNNNNSKNNIRVIQTEFVYVPNGGTDMMKTVYVSGSWNDWRPIEMRHNKGNVQQFKKNLKIR